MVLPILAGIGLTEALIAGGTIGGLGLQWWGSKKQRELEKRKLEQIRQDMLKQQTKTIIIGIVALAVIYMLFFKK